MPFVITKREVTVGNRRTTRMEVAWNNGAPEAEPVKVPAPVALDAKQNAQHSNGSNNGHVPGAASNGYLNGNGNGNGNRNGDQPALPSAVSAELLLAAGKATIDAVAEVEHHARQKGMGDFCFGPENIQKIWVTLFLSAQGRR